MLISRETSLNFDIKCRESVSTRISPRNLFDFRISQEIKRVTKLALFGVRVIQRNNCVIEHNDLEMRREWENDY